MADHYPLVPRFRELECRGAAQDLDLLTGEIERRLVSPWERARDVEQAPILRGEYRVFRRQPSSEKPGLLLHLVAAESGIYVPNIVPTEASELSIDEYNGALVDFYQQFARAAAEALGLQISLGGDEVDLRADLAPETFSALVAFSRASNRSTGSSHPMDRERWYGFLVRLHRSPSEVSSWVLQEWLVLDGWPESVAAELVIEYEFAMGLLNYAEPN